jgi:predicted NBD/HSP70 family sugar kinase
MSSVAVSAGWRPSTKARLLDHIRAAGTVSRVELAAATGLTPATITNVVRELVEEGLVREAGRVQSRGGSPRRLLELQRHAHYAVGIQMDRDTSAVVVLDFAGRLVAQTTLRGAGGGAPEATLRTLADHVDGLLLSGRVPRERVLAAGLVTHGPQDRSRGVLLPPRPTAAWRGYPLTETLSEALGMPVLLENDATAAAIGEQWMGDVPTDTFGVLYMASGLGGGVIVNGEVYRGRASNTVEIGHVTLDVAGPECSCGARGCVEALCGPSAIVTAALGDPVLSARLGLRAQEDQTLVGFERVARAARKQDPRARALLERASRGLGAAAVTLANLFDLDTLVLAGPGFTTAGPLIRDVVADVLNRWAFNRELGATSVLLSRHGGLAAAVGGALLVLRAATDGHADGVTVPLGRLRVGV